jgi:hypothetical protein
MPNRKSTAHLFSLAVTTGKYVNFSIHSRIITETFFILCQNPRSMNRNIFTVLLLTLCFSRTQAQLKSPIISIKPQLSEVIKDFPYNYKNIKGEALNEGEPNTTYASKVEIKEAKGTTITSYVNQKYQSWVWESVLFQTEDIKELQRRYKAYYNDITGRTIFKAGIGELTPTSTYSTPTEELRLWSNQLRMETDAIMYSNLVVDLIAEYVNFQWTVYLRVYDKVKDEEIRPTERN